MSKREQLQEAVSRYKYAKGIYDLCWERVETRKKGYELLTTTESALLRAGAAYIEKLFPGIGIEKGWLDSNIINIMVS